MKTYDHEWFRVKRPIWKMACCDCKLVHAVRFHVSGRKIFMAVVRDNRATAAKRRKRYSKADIGGNNRDAE